LVPVPGLLGVSKVKCVDDNENYFIRVLRSFRRGKFVCGVYQAFSGQGNRLDGKCKTAAESPRMQQSHEIKRFVALTVLLANETGMLARGVPNY